MIPGIFDFKDRYAGDTSAAVQFELTNSVNDGTPTPVDLTGVEILMQIKRRSETTSTKELNESDGITITDAVNGIFVIDAFLVDFVAAKHVYDIQLTFPDGVVKTYLKGSFNVAKDVSR